MKDGKLFSFDTLRKTFSLEKQDFYRYLQLRHYADMKMRNVTMINTRLMELFIKSYNSNY